MSTEAVFKGWAGLDDKACQGNLKFQEFEPKKWDEDDVDVKILYCGICGSDASALSGEWGPVDNVCPQICGHEIVGEVTKVGTSPDNGIKVGQLVGIGAQSDSCRECDNCKDHKENFCPKQAITFNSPYGRGNGKGSISRGGFAKYWRGPSRFAIPLPDGLDPDIAAPLLCGGVTVFTPLERYGAGTKAKNVGVIGVGGLGHMAILLANGMGANVTAISRSDSKKEDAMKLGASNYIAMGDDLKKAFEPHARSLDLIICTSNPSELPVADYLPLLKPEGTFCLVGIVPKPLEISTFPLIMGTAAIAGSNIGNPDAISRMFKFVVEKNIKPWIQKWDMEEINKAMPSFQKGDPRYRFVLVNTDNGGKL
ncbi:uncharacterized protein IL334_007563 [Kwoniella shivajii]|uniref:Enoyl reductase (ER) domain-containing protein n=1 Tax=Kwoniella shivajii TaxID=564305 RepID=A0ABZ1DB53_9TREE|nr:hypothetical protein IL334_007563 [Kwoniella shivajii]